VVPIRNNCVFTLRGDETVGDFINQLSTEGAENPTLLTKDGVKISQTTPMADVLVQPFFITIGKIKYQLQPLPEVLDALTGIDMKTIVQLANFKKIREELEKSGRRDMQYHEYLERCKSLGISENEAKKLSEALHYAGIVWHVADTLLLDTRHIIKTLDQRIDVGTHREEIKNQLNQLETYKQEFATIHEEHENLSRKAKKHGDRWMWAGFTYFVTQTGGLSYLVWGKYDWGIMEPFTYFVGFSGVLLGYAFYSLLKKEYTYFTVQEILAERKLGKLFAKQNFDVARYNFLEAEIKRLNRQLIDDRPI